MFKIAYYEILGVDPALNAKLDDAMDLFNRYTEQYLKNGVKINDNLRLTPQAGNPTINCHLIRPC